jgi:N-acyl homoserine lactone hydrolase
VTLHNGTRYALVGDLVYQMEGITLREERSWLVRTMGADEDAAGNRENLLRVIALKERLPDLPAHEMRAFASVPRLSPPSGVTGASP